MGFFFGGKTNEMNGKEKRKRKCGNGEEEGGDEKRVRVGYGHHVLFLCPAALLLTSQRCANFLEGVGKILKTRLHHFSCSSYEAKK